MMRYQTKIAVCGTLVAICAACVMGVNGAAVAPAARAHRLTAPHPAARPYAPVVASGIHARTAARPSLAVAAKGARKVWRRDGWVTTGAIERRHFWLVRPVDLAVRRRLIFLARRRFFWRHHWRLYELLWLGQGWDYYGHSTTRPAVLVEENAAVIKPKHRPSDVLLQIQALSVLDALQLRDDQVGDVQAALDGLPMAGQVLDADVIDSAAEAHPACVTTAEDMYRGYAQSDDDQVMTSRAKLLDLQGQYHVSMTPTIEITDGARAKAEMIYKMLSASQIASYLAARPEVVPDPQAILMAGLDECGQISEGDYAAYRDSLSDRLGILIRGLDSDASSAVRARVVEMMDQARYMSPSDYAQRRPEFAREAAALAARCSPIELIHHAVAWDLANCLANPEVKAMAAVREFQAHS